MNKGDILSTTEYLQVEKLGKDALGNKAAMVMNLETGETMGIELKLASGYSHGTNFSKEEKVSLTVAVEILENAGDRVFTVEYNKKADPVDVAKRIAALSTKDQGSKTKVARCMLGDDRTMTARLVSVEAKLGRSTVIDLSIKKALKGDWDSRTRQVDHRTIKSIIIGGTKYTVK